MDFSESQVPLQVNFGRYVSQLIKKLGDSKNIIRQETIRALVTIYQVMRVKGDRSQNNFIGLILPYMNNSSNWHIREELLNVLIICFLKSSEAEDFDSFAVVKGALLLLTDQKERIKLQALEALVAYASICSEVKEVVFSLVDGNTFQVIAERLDQGQPPFINEEGALEIPYLDQVELTVDPGVNSAAMGLPRLSRKESLSSGPQMARGSQPGSKSGPRKTSGRRVVPPSANNVPSYGVVGMSDITNKRTASANNLKEDENQYYKKQSPLNRQLASLDKTTSFQGALG